MISQERMDSNTNDKRADGLCFNSLPTELALHVFQYLYAAHQMSSSTPLVCKYWKQVWDNYWTIDSTQLDPERVILSEPIPFEYPPVAAERRMIKHFGDPVEFVVVGGIRKVMGKHMAMALRQNTTLRLAKEISRRHADLALKKTEFRSIVLIPDGSAHIVVRFASEHQMVELLDFLTPERLGKVSGVDLGHRLWCEVLNRRRNWSELSLTLVVKILQAIAARDSRYPDVFLHPKSQRNVNRAFVELIAWLLHHARSGERCVDPLCPLVYEILRLQIGSVDSETLTKGFHQLVYTSKCVTCCEPKYAWLSKTLVDLLLPSQTFEAMLSRVILAGNGFLLRKVLLPHPAMRNVPQRNLVELIGLSGSDLAAILLTKIDRAAVRRSPHLDNSFLLNLCVLGDLDLVLYHYFRVNDQSLDPQENESVASDALPQSRCVPLALLPDFLKVASAGTSDGSLLLQTIARHRDEMMTNCEPNSPLFVALLSCIVWAALHNSQVLAALMPLPAMTFALASKDHNPLYHALKSTFCYNSEILDMLIRDPRVDPSLHENESLVLALRSRRFNVFLRLSSFPTVKLSAFDTRVEAALQSKLTGSSDANFVRLVRRRLGTG